MLNLKCKTIVRNLRLGAPRLFPRKNLSFISDAWCKVYKPGNKPDFEEKCQRCIEFQDMITRINFNCGLITYN